MLNDDNYKKALASANLPTILFFRAGFCGPSAVLNSALDQLYDEYGDRLNIVEVDVEECPKMTREFQVKGTPSLVIIKHGEPLASNIGTMPYADLVTFAGKAWA